MHLGKTLLDAAQHLFIPLQLQLRMQAALHEHPGAAQFYRLPDFFVNGFKIEHITLGTAGALHRRIKRAEGAVFSAEIGVINVAVNDVSDHTFRMNLAAESIRLHAGPDKIVRPKQLQGLMFSERH